MADIGEITIQIRASAEGGGRGGVTSGSRCDEDVFRKQKAQPRIRAGLGL